MDLLLKFMAGLAGFIGFIIALFFGFLSGSFLWFLFILFITAIITVILYALGILLDNQEKILLAIWRQENNKVQVEPKTCARCSHEYDGEMVSCPNCGFK
ncbi:hypothetical protein NC661_20115 [Aquibacillus koreensis]|uniref:Uncharacterized protein n=1 Tax=Aquibacillus koreensis TaxID=279446 RepID=A0A9X4ALN4_9BACI|nr:hypothetical protein [Aquibacillus koreensis]MCT2537895.1 hypothetical protein [Aquibacillus koreensis]MDC3422663.1 hypothetical protein [Aquibacillus koreensis]